MPSGVGVDQLVVAQVFQPRDAELLDAFALEVEGFQLAGGTEFRGEQEVDRGKYQMDMLGVEEIGYEQHDRPDRQPPADMLADHQRLLRPVSPQPGQSIGGRLPAVGAVEGETGADAAGAASDLLPLPADSALLVTSAVPVGEAGVVTVVVGNLPFLGLIVPNIVSMIRGDDLRSNLPWVCLLGIAIVTVCDIIGRTIIMPFEVPVSLILGIVGSAVFVLLLLRQRRHG